MRTRHWFIYILILGLQGLLVSCNGPVGGSSQQGIDFEFPPESSGCGQGITQDPVIVNLSNASANEGTSSFPITQIHLRTDDADTASTAVAYTVTRLPAFGTVDLAGIPLGLGGGFTQNDIGSGLMTYTHGGGEGNPDIIGFQVTDGTCILQGVLEVTIAPADDAPVAANIAPPNFTEEIESMIGLSYTDAEGDLATVCAITPATASITESTVCSCDGNGYCDVGITSNNNFNGATSFTYTVTANGLTSNVATATFTIVNSTDAPIASVVSPANFNEDTESIIVLNYVDPDGNLATSCGLTETTSITESTTCACVAGVCSVGVTGLSNYNGLASFAYTVTANSLTSNISTASLTIDPVDDAPVAASITPTNILEDTLSTITLSYTDVENDLATTCNVTATGSVDALACTCLAGTCAANVQGISNYTGAASFAYTVTAGLTSNLATADFNVSQDLIIINLDSTSFPVNEASGIANIVASLNKATNQTVSIDFLTTDGTASSVGNLDFTSTSGTASFPPGVTTTIIASIPITADTLNEDSETLTFALNAGTIVNANSVGDGTAILTILDDDATPSLTLSGPNVGILESAGNMIFTITLGAVSGKTISLEYDAVSSDALSASDFTGGISIPVVIPAGASSHAITIPLIDDTLDEQLLESFPVTIKNPTNATIHNPSATAIGAIMDDDAPSVLSVDDSSALEGREVTFTASLDRPSTFDVTFDVVFGSTPDTASSPADYNGTAQTGLIIPAGQTIRTFTVSTISGDAPESNEVFTASITNTTNATLSTTTGAATGIGTIFDVTLSVFPASVSEGGILSFTVGITNPTSFPVLFDYINSNGTALSGIDYETASASAAAIPAGSTSISFPVTTIEDTLFELDETFFITISNIINANPGTLIETMTIMNDELAPVLNISAPDTTEGQTFTFTAALSTTSGQDVVFDWRTIDGLATDENTAPQDYFLNSASNVTIPAGSLTATFTISTVDDSFFDGIEHLEISVPLTSSVTLGSLPFIASIVDNEPTPSLTVGDIVMSEAGAESFPVSLTGPSERNVTFQYRTNNGTALSGTDYTNIPLTSTSFPSMATEVSIPAFAINGDAFVEPVEQFTLSISNVTIAALADAIGIARINDDDHNQMGIDFAAGAQDVLTFSFDPTGAKIVWISDENTAGIFELFSADIDGQNKALLNTPLVAGKAVTSFLITPDGSKVIYRADETTTGVFELFVRNIDGSGVVTQLTPGVTGAEDVREGLYAISPDSAKVVYIADETTAGVTELYSVDNDGGNPAKISQPMVAGNEVTDFKINPLSTKVAYRSDLNVDQQFELFIVDIGDGNDATLSSVGAGQDVVAGGYEFNALATKVIYMSDERNTGDIEIFTNDDTGGGRQILTALFPGTDVVSFAPTADGSKVVFIANNTNLAVNDLYSVDYDGANLLKLSTVVAAGGNVTNFTISPDSSRVIYLADETTNDEFNLYSITPLTGAGKTTLNAALGANQDVTSQFSVAPDSSRVVYVSDEGTDEQFELFAMDIDGSGTRTNLSTPFLAGSDILTVNGFQIQADSNKVVFHANKTDTLKNEVYEVKLSDGTGLETPKNQALVLNGNVTNYSISSNGVLGYIADRDTDDVFELFTIGLHFD